MKTLAILAIACCLWSAAARGQTSSTSAPSSEPATQPLDLGAYAPMAEDCALSDEQKARIAKKAALLRELQNEESRQAAELIQKLATAYQEKDAEGVKRLDKEMGYLRDAARKMSESIRADILGALTADQRMVWETSQLKRQALARYHQAKIDLTDAQREKLNKLCQELGCELAADPKAPTASRTSGAMSRIDQQVLTEEQNRRASMAE